jgi:hypothetical protein
MILSFFHFTASDKTDLWFCSFAFFDSAPISGGSLNASTPLCGDFFGIGENPVLRSFDAFRRFGGFNSDL